MVHCICKLTGFASEESIFLLDIAGNTINIKGILLAWNYNRALGVLDDVTFSQVALCKRTEK